MISGGNTYYYHHDRLGSVTALTSPTGDTEWTYQYEPFGALRSSTKVDPSAPTNPLGYIGEYTDPNTNKLDLRARQYDPTTGRFLGVDPQPGGIDDPYQSAYDYADDNPTDLSDPSGETPGADAWATGGAGVSAIFAAGAATASAWLVSNPTAAKIAAGELSWTFRLAWDNTHPGKTINSAGQVHTAPTVVQTKGGKKNVIPSAAAGVRTPAELEALVKAGAITEQQKRAVEKAKGWRRSGQSGGKKKPKKDTK